MNNSEYFMFENLGTFYSEWSDCMQPLPISSREKNTFYLSEHLEIVFTQNGFSLYILGKWK